MVVAVLDTGVAYENYSQGNKKYYLAPDLANTTFVAGYDFIENDTHPNDDNSHGTHVAGTIAQSTNNALGVAGVAFQCAVMPVKVLGRNGSGTAQTLADGLHFAADNGAEVINMSLGWPVLSGVAYDPGETVRAAVQYAYDSGVTIVCASGNDYVSAVAYPAAYDDYCIAVGATRYDEQRAGYSNYGASLDISAPGGDVGVDQNADGYGDGVLQNTFNPTTRRTNDFGYWFFDGTSMATPHVAGVAALVIASGVSGPVAVRQALESTAEDKGPAGWDQNYGHGIVDAAAALAVEPNEPPVALDESAVTQEDTPVSVNVLANDTDADEEDVLTVTNLTQPSHGTADLNADHTVTYTPDANFNGDDSFTYTANDGKLDSNVATVTIHVDPVQDPPVANDDAATTQVDTPVTIDVLANDTDPDGDTLAVTSVSDPPHGAASVTDNSVTYTPDSGFVGDDSFQYSISDGNGGVDSATVAVSVQASAPPPTAWLTIDLTKQTPGKRWRVIAVVTAQENDAGGAPIAGATVEGHWSGDYSGPVTGTTQSDGTVSFRTKLLNGSGTVTLTVDGVTKNGTEHILAGETSDSLSHP